MNMSSSPSLGKYSCTPAQEQQARTALCSATRSAARSAARCALRLRDALRARSDELHNAMPCQKTRKCAPAIGSRWAAAAKPPVTSSLELDVEASGRATQRATWDLCVASFLLACRQVVEANCNYAPREADPQCQRKLSS